MASKKKREREERVEAAVKVASHGQQSLRIAGNRFDIPKSTLHDHLTGRMTHTGAGRPTVLAEAEEKAIVRSCQELAQCGFGLDRTTVGLVVKAYLEEEERENLFKDDIPGKHWWQGFLRHWPCLTERKPQHMPSARAQSSIPEVMNMYFENVQV